MSQGRTMGLFSFLTGGKKKAKVGAPAPSQAAEARPTVTDKKADLTMAKVSAAPPTPQLAVTTGVRQAKLRLKLAASLRAGAHGEAYEAARGLADIQAKAGRRVGARVWALEAERIKSGLAA